MADINQLYLLLGAALFCIGLSLILIRKNIIVILMGVELMLNAANLNFISAGDSSQSVLDAQVMSIFVIVLAVAEAAVALAIVIKVVEAYKTSNIDELNKLKG